MPPRNRGATAARRGSRIDTKGGCGPNLPQSQRARQRREALDNKRAVAARIQSRGGFHEASFRRCHRGVGIARGGRHRIRTAADRHQVQPRRRRRHAEGQGRRIFQEAGRGTHQGSGQGRGVSRTARCSRTARRWRRCSWARCRCWRRRVAKFGPLGVREFEVFDLPYIFDSHDDLHKVTDRPGRRRCCSRSSRARASSASRSGTTASRR